MTSHSDHFADVVERIHVTLRALCPRGIAGSCPVVGTYATDHLLRRDGGHDSGKVAPFRGVAQLVERVLGEHEAAGSGPVTSTELCYDGPVAHG